ncbi:Palmitoyl-monogalactosyldiacylglycerol delta-7 desaturase, chloroplastic [Linum perenne]
MHEHQIKPNTTMKAMAKPRRKLTPWDISAISTIGATHLLALYAPFCFSWSLLFMAYVIMFITGCLGICLSYHRNLSHKSFKITPKWLEYLFAYCGVHALQGDPLTWVSNHRFHHRHTDTERDPHSAVLGFWHSHMGWIFDSALVKEKCGKRNNVEDLKSQAFYRWWVGILAYGEGWHNNHHAFQYSARQGLEWWQIDITWYIVKFLEANGLAYDVKLPNHMHMQKLAIKST